MNRIPLNIVVTETGATTSGVLTAVMVADLDELVAERDNAETLLGEAMILLREHQEAHGTAVDHGDPSHIDDKDPSDPEWIAQDWRIGRDAFLDKVGG